MLTRDGLEVAIETAGLDLGPWHENAVDDLVALGSDVELESVCVLRCDGVEALGVVTDRALLGWSPDARPSRLDWRLIDVLSWGETCIDLTGGGVVIELSSTAGGSVERVVHLARLNQGQSHTVAGAPPQPSVEECRPARHRNAFSAVAAKSAAARPQPPAVAVAALEPSWTGAERSRPAEVGPRLRRRNFAGLVVVVLALVGGYLGLGAVVGTVWASDVEQGLGIDRGCSQEGVVCLEVE